LGKEEKNTGKMMLRKKKSQIVQTDCDINLRVLSLVLFSTVANIFFFCTQASSMARLLWGGQM
jgi:hypothetical protein